MRFIFWSLHSGGLRQFVFADGSVRFLDTSAVQSCLLSRRAPAAKPWECHEEAREKMQRLTFANQPVTPTMSLVRFLGCFSASASCFSRRRYCITFGDDAPGAVIDQTDASFPIWPLAENRVLHVAQSDAARVRIVGAAFC